MNRLAGCPVCGTTLPREFDGTSGCKECGARLAQDRRRDRIWSWILAVPLLILFSVAAVGLIPWSIAILGMAGILGIAYVAWPYTTTYGETPPNGFCAACGYDLRESHGPTCKECGTPIRRG
jgi:predicted nucleic acid-binding Zn ribbon protein